MQCGAALPQGSKFCSNCGAATSAASTAPVARPTTAPGRTYSTNILLVFLFVAGLASIFINVGLTFLVVLISAIAVYSDARNLNAGKTASKESMSPITYSPFSWGALTLLFWIIFMPWYLYLRRQIFIANQ